MLHTLMCHAFTDRRLAAFGDNRFLESGAAFKTSSEISLPREDLLLQQWPDVAAKTRD